MKILANSSLTNSNWMHLSNCVVNDRYEVIYLDGICKKSATSALVEKFSLSEQVYIFTGEKQEGLKRMNVLINDLEYKTESINKDLVKVAFFKRGFLNTPIPEEVIYGIAKTKEEVKEKARLQLQTQLEKMPYPIKKEWVENIVKKIEIKTDFEQKVLTSVNGNIFYSIEIPKGSELQALIRSAHKEEIWKESFGRVPKKEFVKDGVYNIPAFNFKDWMQFTKSIGGIEKLDTIPLATARGVVSLFELLGSQAASTIINERGFAFAHLIEVEETLLQLKMGKIKKEEVKKNYNLLYKIKDMSESDFIAAWNNMSYIIYKAEESGQKITKSFINNTLMELKYNHVEFPEVATVCARAKVGQVEFERYQKHWKENISKREVSSRSIPTLKGEVPGTKVAWEMCDSNDPNILVVGNETNCCQNLSSYTYGAHCVTFMLENPSRSTVFKITDNGKTIAQSFVWRNGPDVCFDNIEALGEGLRSSVIAAYEAYAEKLRTIAQSYGIERLTVGGRYSTHIIPSSWEKVIKKTPIPSQLGYTDAKENQFLLGQYPRRG